MTRPVDPNVVEFEHALLGSLIYDRFAFSRVENLLSPADFYIERHAWIFQAMQELAGESSPIDILTVSKRLEQKGKLRALGDVVYLTLLINRSPTSAHAEYYARQIRLYSLLRRLVKDAGRLARLAYRREPPEKILEIAGTLLQELLEAIQIALTTKKGESCANGRIDIGDC